jgi:glycosyltransferase involved in cell wall biosynthesis
MNDLAKNHSNSGMKVLLISVRADLGGGPEHLYRLVEGLGYRVRATIALPNEPPYWDRAASLENVDDLIEIPKRKFELAVLFRLAQFVRKSDIQVIHSHGKGAGLYSRLVGLLTGRPVVHTFHGLHIGDYGFIKRNLYISLEKMLGALTSRAIAVSDGERELLANHNIISDRKLQTVANGVPLSPVRPRKKPDGTARIIAVNRFNHQKNPDLLVRVGSALEARGLDFQIKVIGDGEPDDVARIKALATSAGLEHRFAWIGGVDDPRSYYRAADVFLSTSRWEGMPLALLEAMAESVAIVATDVVGNRDALDHGRVGWLYEDEDAEAAADQIVLALSGTQSDKTKLAWELVSEEFSVNRMCFETFQIYSSLPK